MNHHEWPRISVVTPSYNQAPFLEATIRSVLDQQYPNLQYGVVDGNSTDGSIDIINSYRDQLDFAIIEDDDGQAEAINKGMQLANGDIVCYLNSDDTLLEGCLHTIGRYFAKHLDHQWVIGDCVEIDAAGQRLRASPARAAQSLAHALIRNQPLHLPQPSMFWRRELLEQFGLFNAKYHFAFDFDLWCRFLAGNVNMHQIDAQLATYRLHEQSKTCTMVAGFLREHIAIERYYAAAVPGADRRALRRVLGYRARQYAVLTATGRPWKQIMRRPWWLGSQQIRGLLIQGPSGRDAA